MSMALPVCLFHSTCRLNRLPPMSCAYVTDLPPPDTTPSATVRSDSGTASRFDASSTRTRRASAAALRKGRAPSWIPVLPEAPPWLHEVPVSPISTSTRSKATSSSSATICAIAGSRLCPMSILPKKACTRPLGSTAIQESSSVGTRFCLAAETPAAIDSSRGRKTVTTSAPLACRNSRREIGAFMIASSRHALLSTLDGAQDRNVGAAAALEPRERIAQLRVARLWIFLQDRSGGHDPAVDTVAALRHLFLDVGGLQRVGLLGCAEALDGSDALPARRGHRQHARAHRLAVQVHGAGAALRQTAAEMRVVEAEIVAQRVKQRHLGLGVHRNALAVDGHPECGHVGFSPRGKEILRLMPHLVADSR